MRAGTSLPSHRYIPLALGWAVSHPLPQHITEQETRAPRSFSHYKTHLPILPPQNTSALTCRLSADRLG